MSNTTSETVTDRAWRLPVGRPDKSREIRQTASTSTQFAVGEPVEFRHEFGDEAPAARPNGQTPVLGRRPAAPPVDLRLDWPAV